MDFETGEEALPPWVADLPDRPTVYATLGTIVNASRAAALFPLMLAALRDEPINLILTVGRDNDPAQFGPQPATSTSSGTSRRACSCRTATWW